MLWTSHNETIVRQMFAQGATDSEIAERLRRTPLAVEKRRMSLNLRHKPGRGPTWTPENDALLRKLRSDGLSFSQVAYELNCGFSRNACIGRAQRIGLVASVRKLDFKRAEPRGVNVVEKVNYARRSARKQSRPPEPIPKLTYSTEFLGVSLLDLTSGMCRFPRGEGVNTLFCGQPVKPDTSWCPHCSTIVYARRHDLSDEERERRRLHGRRLGRGMLKQRAA